MKRKEQKMDTEVICRYNYNHGESFENFYQNTGTSCKNNEILKGRSLREALRP